MFITALDQTIVATAIPTITYDLNSASGYVWIGGAYLLSCAASGPIWAKLSDIFGRKPIILMAVGLFFASSILCAKASSMKMLIVGRTFQGVGGGGLAPLVMITISDLFSIRYGFTPRSQFLMRLILNRNRSLYIGLMELVWIIAGGVGPVLGGAFTEKLSWRCKYFWKFPGHVKPVLTTQQGTSGLIFLCRVPHLSFCLYIWTSIILKRHCATVSKQ